MGDRVPAPGVKVTGVFIVEPEIIIIHKSTDLQNAEQSMRGWESGAFWHRAAGRDRDTSCGSSLGPVARAAGACGGSLRPQVPVATGIG